MKYALSALAGALLVTSAVIWAGGNQAAMFLAGGFTASLVWMLSAEVIGFAGVGRVFLALDGALRHNSHAGVAGNTAAFFARESFGHASAQSQRAATPGRRKNHTALKANVLPFQKTTVLSTVQQDVLSALCNQGMPFSKAQRLVIEASEGHPGIGFDSLFRLCVAPAKAANA